MTKGDDIQERLVDLAVSVVRLTEHLPNSAAGKHVGDQLLRSGTSPAFDYGEVRETEDGKDVSHKLGVVLKDLNETGIALEILKRSEMISAKVLAPVQRECKELSQMINSSIKTVEKGK